MIDERNLVIDLVRHSGINAIAEECHRQAVARGKYPEGWSLSDGLAHVVQELSEWAAEVINGNPEGAKRGFGNVLHVILSLGHHMSYDEEAELQDAMQRNRERAKEGV